MVRDGRTGKRGRGRISAAEKARNQAKTVTVEEEYDVEEISREEAATPSTFQNDEVDIEGNEEIGSDDDSETETPEVTPTKEKKNNGSGGKRSASRPNRSTAANPSNLRRSRKRRESGTSSEEERWLTAIEKGKLNDVDEELKKIKDPKLMTARQRAMYERGLDKDPDFPTGEMLMSLPTGYKEKEKPQTAEDIQKAQMKIQRRRQQADEKREKDKKKTMERLLKKQETKQRSAARNKANRAAEPMIRYQNTYEGASILIPLEHEFPLKHQSAKTPPPIQLCGIAGCNQPKVYNCSKTNIPLCSLACYKRNVQKVKEIMC